jgi:hypothetical protein
VAFPPLASGKIASVTAAPWRLLHHLPARESGHIDWSGSRALVQRAIANPISTKRLWLAALAISGATILGGLGRALITARTPTDRLAGLGVACFGALLAIAVVVAPDRRIGRLKSRLDRDD